MLGTTENEEPVDGWLVKYDLYRRKKLSLSNWLECVEQITGKLYEQLLAPVHYRLVQRYHEARRLVLVPNKGLNLLPLHACWWPTVTGGRRYLLDDYEIAYTPSCQVLKRCLAREQGNGSPARSLFAVQNPDGSLPFADWEVEKISEFFPETNRKVLKGQLATRAAVEEGIGFGEEKLFSCHGLFDLADVEQSHLGLADGMLSVPQVVPMNLRGTWLGVMSACETGLTDIHDVTDEYQGLSAAFLVAGAQTVVPSLWAVNDLSTALLMQRFHWNLYKEKMAKAPALREAQRWLRDLSSAELAAILEVNQEKLAEAEVVTKRMSKLEQVALSFFKKDVVAHQDPEHRTFANPHWWAAFQCVGAGWSPSSALK